MNADGKADLAVANEVSNNVSVLLNRAVDTPAPRVRSVSPAEAATEVARGANVEASFSETMDPSTITDQTFTLTKQNCPNPAPARVLYVSASKKATLFPADKVWTFSTVDTRPPTPAVITSPLNDSFDNDGSFTVSGTAEANSTIELFEGAASRGTDTADSSGNWSISLDGVSQGEHTYAATAKDTVNNTSGLFNSLKVTVDAAGPVVDSTVPVPGARGVAWTTNIMATFSDRMDESTLTAESLKPVNTATGKRVKNVAVSYDDATRRLTIDPFASSATWLAKNTK